MIEVVFASSVLLASIMIMISMFDTSVSILSFTTTRSMATQIANEVIEDIRGKDYEQVLSQAPMGAWPEDPDLDHSVTPPRYKDVDDNAQPLWRTIATTTAVGYLPMEQNVIRRNISFTIRKYVLWVADSSVTTAYKRLVVRVRWPSPGAPGEVVMSTNYAKSDTKDPRPSIAIIGVVSKNYNYFKGVSEDTTLSQDDSIRGPNAGAGVRTPTVYARASVNSAKATGISRIDFALLDPTGNTLTTGIDSTKDSNGNYSWDLATTAYGDGQGYLIQAVAVDSLGKKEVATVRVNIDNTDPTAPQNVNAVDMPGSAKRLHVSWDWVPDSGDQVPVISRFIVYRKPSGGVFTRRAAVPGDSVDFMDAEVSGTYVYNIQAVDTAGNVMMSGEKDRVVVKGAPTDLIAPVPVTTESAASASWKAIDLYWSPTSDDDGGSGMAGYFWYSSDDYSNWTIVGETADVVSDPLYYRDTGLKPGKIYYYRPIAFDSEGNTSTLGPVVNATTPLR